MSIFTPVKRLLVYGAVTAILTMPLAYKMGYYKGALDNSIDENRNSRLERITDDLEGIADFTLAELKSKDIGSWMNDGYAGIKIPTLREVMTKLPKETSYVLEIKPQKKKVEESY